MKRTQIYLNENLYQDLEVGARMSSMTVSAYIRKLLSQEIYLEKFTPGQKQKKPKPTELTIITKKAIKFGKKDLARNFDDYLEKSLQ